MNSDPAGFEELELRINVVEKQNKRLKQLGAALMLAVASIITMGQASSRKIIEADEFIVRDSSGKVRIKLAVEGKSGEPIISLFGVDGKSRVKLETGILSGLTLYDGQERQRGSFTENDPVGSVLMLMHEDGKVGSRIREDEIFSSEILTLRDSSYEYTLMDDSGSKRARLFMTKKSTGTITLPGSTEQLPITMEATPTLAFYGDKGEVKTVVDNTYIVFRNAKGNATGSLGNGILSLSGEGSSGAVMAPGVMGVFDAEGYSANLGVSNVVTPHTGETHKRSAASLLFFDNNKNVIWKAPN